LRRYAGMSLMRPSGEEGDGDPVCRLSPRPDGTRAARALPRQTPWRVVLIGDRPGALLESGTIYCLNDPSVIKDVSCIRPGKITFPWWNGDVYDGQSGPPILSFEMAGKYIDFCARHGIPTHSLTSTEGTVSPWYQQSKPGVAPGPDTDVTHPRPGFDLAGIERYADSKDVRL
jgi:alpha-glucosidase